MKAWIMEPGTSAKFQSKLSVFDKGHWFVWEDGTQPIFYMFWWYLIPKTAI